MTEQKKEAMQQLGVGLQHREVRPEGAEDGGKVYIPNARGFMVVSLAIGGSTLDVCYEVYNGTNAQPAG